MNPEPNSFLTKVTPFSKALAAILFIIMPFVGLYIGYTYAPEKVVEVERIVGVEKVEERKHSDYLSRKTYHVDETITLEMGTFDSRTLVFRIGAYRYMSDAFLTDHIVFNEQNNTVSLVDYFSDYPSTATVLQLAKKTDSDLETQLEDLYFEYIDSTGQTDRYEITEWKRRCTLNSAEKLQLVDSSVSEDYFDRYCVWGSFDIVDDLLVYNPGYPSDAHEPKIVRGSVIVK